MKLFISLHDLKILVLLLLNPSNPKDGLSARSKQVVYTDRVFSSVKPDHEEDIYEYSI